MSSDKDKLAMFQQLKTVHGLQEGWGVAHILQGLEYKVGKLWKHIRCRGSKWTGRGVLRRRADGVCLVTKEHSLAFCAVMVVEQRPAQVAPACTFADTTCIYAGTARWAAQYQLPTTERQGMPLRVAPEGGGRRRMEQGT